MPQATQLARAEQGLKQGVSASEGFLVSGFYCLPEQVQWLMLQQRESPVSPSRSGCCHPEAELGWLAERVGSSC